MNDNLSRLEVKFLRIFEGIAVGPFAIIGLIILGLGSIGLLGILYYV